MRLFLLSRPGCAPRTGLPLAYLAVRALAANQVANCTDLPEFYGSLEPLVVARGVILKFDGNLVCKCYCDEELRRIGKVHKGRRTKE